MHHHKRNLFWIVVSITALGGCAEMQSTMGELGLIEQRTPIPMPSGPSLSSDNVVYYHQAFSARPYPVEDLVLEGSGVRRHKDEFSRQSTIRYLIKDVSTSVAAAKQKPSVYTVINTRFGEYDFKAQAFPTGFNKDARLTYKTSGYVAGDLYGASFLNPEIHEKLRLSESAAKDLVAWFRKSGDRKVVTVISGTVVDAIPGSPADQHTRQCVAYLEEKEATRRSQMESTRLLAFGSTPERMKCDLEPRLVRLRVERIDYYLPNGRFIGTTSAAK